MGDHDTYWKADGSYLPPVKPHTKAKHQILADYIKNWIVTLCGNNMGKRKTVTLIDGFCGGGMYVDPENNNKLWKGSPICMIEMVERGLEIVKHEKSKFDYELNAKFIFIDSKPDHINCLKIQMQRAGLEHYLHNPEKCEFICGEFEPLAERLVSEVRVRRGSSFFFLDPFGYTDVTMATIRKIISLGKSEIIYTFMIDFIRRFLSEREGSLKRAFTDILEAEDYFIPASGYNILDQQDYLRNETLRLFRNKGSARYVYSFALLPNRTIVEYYLVHLASSPTAQRVIKNALWEHNNIELIYQFNRGVTGLGFSTPEYYERETKIFNIEEENIRASIESLNGELMPVIHGHEDGIPFEELHIKTMQTNPSPVNHYMSYVDEQRDMKEIEVWRNGKITKAKQLKPGDIIIKSSQGKLFDLKSFKRK
jgi:three-Cys-motif partner protein